MNAFAPPSLPRRLLSRALGPDPESRTVLGDLQEDFNALARTRGLGRARRWYWREATGLAVGTIVTRLARRLFTIHHDFATDGTMTDMFSSTALVQDTRYATRAVRRDLGFFAFATLIIGVGIAASTAVFSLVSPLMIRDLPFADPERLVWIALQADNSGGMSSVTSRTSNVRDFRELATSFEGIAGYNAFFQQDAYNLVGTGAPQRLAGVGVTDNFLDVLGIEPHVGRGFTPEEGASWESPKAVILSHGLWIRRFGADPGVVGTAITLNDEPWEVVGVLPPSFDFASVFAPAARVDILVPWPINNDTDRWGNTTSMIARLAPGATVESAQSELDRIVAGLQEDQPDRWGLDAHVSDLTGQISGPFRAALLLLIAAAAAVMLIVCVNLSNMLLARSPKRSREMAVRRAMGATHGRLVRQLLIETMMLSGAGAAVGIVLAVFATRFVAGSTGLAIPLLQTVRVDLPALGFTVIVALVAAILSGLMPALQTSGEGGEGSLGASTRGASPGRRSRRLRELLVVSEVALALVLLVFGGLFMRSFQRVLDVNLGFRPENTIAWQLSTTRDFESEEARTAFFDQVVAAVAQVPGVESVGLTDALPLGRNRQWGISVTGMPPDEREWMGVFPHLVNETYLPTMRVPLTAGRGFTPEDGIGTEPVVVINETAARALFGGEDAVGRTVDVGGDEYLVIGVAGDIKHVTLERGAGNQAYLLLEQRPDYSTLDMVVRGRVAPEAIRGPVTAALASVDPGMPVNESWTLSERVDLSVSPRRFTLTLLGSFAATALILAALGIYGVLSYSVSERIHEIGIRMALGESAAGVRRRVVLRTMGLAAVGVLIGVVAALAGTRLVGSLLFGVEPTDPVTFGMTAAVLLGVSGLAGFVPALRASRTKAVDALRTM